jgi:hypothetical protein
VTCRCRSQNQTKIKLLMTDRPHENCYWVVPEKLLAGEYPGAPKRDDALRKLASIVGAGVSHFIDLTEKHDLVAPYDQLLHEVAQTRQLVLGYDRFPIPDVGIPESPELTNRILDRIDGLTAAGIVPYVHCWGGVGRTGTIIGCWLVRHGRSGPDALKVIADHWQTVAKRQRHPRSPESSLQEHYVLNWARVQGADGRAAPAMLKSTPDEIAQRSKMSSTTLLPILSQIDIPESLLARLISSRQKAPEALGRHMLALALLNERLSQTRSEEKMDDASLIALLNSRWNMYLPPSLYGEQCTDEAVPTPPVPKDLAR